ncbi:hypothetical protein E1B28_005433 [Marasmius oreades]|uniref:Uncharacterized protein n=1 Tax=Marasmius oreades TaxID=181124 RepID=A0A9P7UW50_9AGAR|nr:uncharacterized protein E1B28_005433 [Marasmius oreades]KAG7094609.1 hypothetical protein E1B28_005433 [Marasmius oreades]
MNFHCSGCNSKAFSYQGYQTHLRLSQNPECRRLYDYLHSYVPSDSDSSDAETDEGDEEDPVPFAGDYFSPMYTPEDFGQSLDEEGRDTENMTPEGSEGGKVDSEVDTSDSEGDSDLDAAEQAIIESIPEVSRSAPTSMPYYPESDNEALDTPVPLTRRQAIDERLRKEIFIEKFPSILAGTPLH